MIELINIQALRGPNLFSLDHRLILMRIKIHEDILFSDYSTNHELLDQLKVEISAPFDVLKLIGNLALHLQINAGYEVEFLQILETNEAGVYRVIFEYLSEDAGKLAGKFACSLTENILLDQKADCNEAINELRKIKIAEPELTQNFKTLLNPKNIPVIAVTGTNGKTTTSRLIAHICHQAGIKVGFTTSDGIYINAGMIEKGDTTGPASANTVLQHPDVELAVLETARGGILRAGLAFGSCQIAVVTNVQPDHLGLGDIHTVEEMAKVKGLIVDVLKPGGIAVLNLENEHTKRMATRQDLQYAWFSIHQNPVWPENFKFIAFVDKHKIVVNNNIETILEIKFEDCPISFNGTVPFMIENAMAAILACLSHGVSAESIKEGIRSFYPSAEQTPGRLNVFDFHNFKVMVDFAHNPDGFSGIKEFLKHIQSPFKIGIITGTGDRPDASTIELGKLSAEMFDYIIIHQAKFHRGRTAQEIVDLLVSGIKSVNPATHYEYIPDEIEPLAYAIEKAISGSFITALSDVLDDPIHLISSYQKNPTINKLSL